MARVALEDDRLTGFEYLRQCHRTKRVFVDNATKKSYTIELELVSSISKDVTYDSYFTLIKKRWCDLPIEDLAGYGFQLLRIIMIVQHDFDLTLRAGYIDLREKKIKLLNSVELDEDSRSINFNLKYCFSHHMFELLSPMYMSARGIINCADPFEFVTMNFKDLLKDNYKICQFKTKLDNHNPFCQSRTYNILTGMAEMETIRIEANGMFTATVFDVLQYGFKEIAQRIFDYSVSNFV